MEKIKRVWYQYPRGWMDIGTLAGIFISISWFAADILLDTMPSILKWVDLQFLKILVTAAFAGVIYFCFDFLYYASRRGAAVRLLSSLDQDFSRNLKSPDCLEVLVFASGGEEAKARFLALSNENFIPKQSIKIKVLLRSDGTPARNNALNQLVDRWKKDVDQITQANKAGFCFSTEFATYQFPVMLKGYIIGESFAALSWYARSSHIRSLSNIPMFVTSGKLGVGKSVIEQARSMFEHYFTVGLKL